METAHSTWFLRPTPFNRENKEVSQMLGSQNRTCSIFTTVFERTGKDWHKTLLCFTVNILPLPISSLISFSSSSLPGPLIISRIQLQFSSTHQLWRTWRKATRAALIPVKLLALWEGQQKPKSHKAGEAFLPEHKPGTKMSSKAVREMGVPALHWFEHEFSAPTCKQTLCSHSVPSADRSVKALLFPLTQQDLPLVSETAGLACNRKDKAIKFYLSFWLL